MSSWVCSLAIVAAAGWFWSALSSFVGGVLLSLGFGVIRVAVLLLDAEGAEFVFEQVASVMEPGGETGPLSVRVEAGGPYLLVAARNVESTAVTANREWSSSQVRINVGSRGDGEARGRVAKVV